MAAEEMDYEKWLAGVVEGMGTGQEGGRDNTCGNRDEDIPPWEDEPGDVPASNLFPALSSSYEGDSVNRINNSPLPPLPPPTPERDRDGYDRNNWSRLLRQVKDMRPEIAEYLETLYETGIKLELKKYKTRDEKGEVRRDAKGKPVIIEKFKFTPGSNKNWTDDRIKEVMSALYTYMAYLPARKELGQDSVVVQAMEAAIGAGGLLAVNEGGLRFDWSRVGSQEKIDYARGMMDQCGAEIMSYIKLAERRIKDIGFVVALAEMSDCVEDFG